MAELPVQPPSDAKQIIVSSFCDFFTVAVHCILFQRAIYPHATFLSARKYNCMVRQNRHPDVCAWINDAVTAVHNELAKGVIERVSMVISSSNSVPLERFVFDVSSLPVYSDGDEIVETDHSSSAEETESPLASIIIPMADVEEQYRATLMKISTCDAKLAKLPENCVFTISVELKDRADPPIGHPQPWIPAQPSLERAGHELKVREHAKIMGPKSTPLRSIETERIKIECWVQESQAKFSLGQSEL